MSDAAVPRVFVSHASEDKEAHAEPLARALLARGVDAWYDQWEIGPGDSLVQKIYEEGLKGAQGMVVVLSCTSVEKPWVKAELDAGVVRRIEGSLRLMPIVVDDCEVPQSLRATLWLDVRKDGLEAVADKVAAAMHGISRKPPVGPPPQYVQAARAPIAGLNPVDEIVLEALYGVASRGQMRLIQPPGLIEELQERGVSEAALAESVDVLVNRGILRSKNHNARLGHYAVEMPYQVVLQLAALYGTDVDAAKRKVAALILNEGVADLDDLAARSGLAIGIVDAILAQFQVVGFLRLSRTMKKTSVYGESPSFRRWLADGL